MTTVKEIISHLQSLYTPEAVVAVAIWQVDDVLGRAKERGITVSEEQAEEIIHRIHRKHDASLGISWDTLDCYTDDCLSEK